MHQSSLTAGTMCSSSKYSCSGPPLFAAEKSFIAAAALPLCSQEELHQSYRQHNLPASPGSVPMLRTQPAFFASPVRLKFPASNSNPSQRLRPASWAESSWDGLLGQSLLAASPSSVTKVLGHLTQRQSPYSKVLGQLPQPASRTAFPSHRPGQAVPVQCQCLRVAPLGQGQMPGSKTRAPPYCPTAILAT